MPYYGWEITWGVAMGPAIGGFIAATSYTAAFLIAAGCMMIYGLLIAFRAKETLQVRTKEDRSLETKESSLVMIGSFAIAGLCPLYSASP